VKGWGCGSSVATRGTGFNPQYKKKKMKNNKEPEINDQ
jgi:hypothetical protein